MQWLEINNIIHNYIFREERKAQSYGSGYKRRQKKQGQLSWRDLQCEKQIVYNLGSVGSVDSIKIAPLCPHGLKAIMDNA